MEDAYKLLEWKGLNSKLKGENSKDGKSSNSICTVIGKLSVSTRSLQPVPFYCDDIQCRDVVSCLRFMKRVLLGSAQQDHKEIYVIPMGRKSSKEASWCGNDQNTKQGKLMAVGDENSSNGDLRPANEASDVLPQMGRTI